ncbi:MAG: DUF1015 family protein [Sporocytophaga sp.]|uniref:DUF1015 family protein n=1 Tax=Sporocytophaga sp. TaxID=2231183 RepID=UPI001B2EC1ED|nr:DUF1015 family protein [Sporocytophaga sp.]MBO9702458.1 DUF1015 family protein [Sporocytophaga sp.]
MPEVFPLEVYMYNDLQSLPNLSFPLMPKEEFSNDLESLYNIPFHSILLTYPKSSEGKDSSFQDWKKNKVLKKEAPAIYKYTQEYNHPVSRKPYKRIGILVGLKVDDWGPENVLPHEGINSEVVEQGIQFLEKYQVNSSPIHLLYSDPEKSFQNYLENPSALVSKFTDTFGTTHKLEKFEENAKMNLNHLFKNNPLFLADGHHRYQTMILYNEKYGQKALIPAYISLMENEPPTILPFHRLVKLSEFKEEKLLKILRSFFQLQPISSENVEAFTSREDEGEWGLILKSQSFILKPINEKVKHFINKKAYNEAGQKMALIDYLVLKYLENFKKEQPKNWFNLKFSYNFTKLSKKVQSGEADFGLILKGVSMKTLRKTVLNNSILPEKSTFFYPKMLAGLVFYDLTDRN